MIGNPAYLAASPDGVLVDQSGRTPGIIEIKCPFSASKLSVREACTQLPNFYCSEVDGELVLHDHIYYYQVQGTMACANVMFCDFIVWTPTFGRSLRSSLMKISRLIIFFPSFHLFIKISCFQLYCINSVLLHYNHVYVTSKKC